MSLDPSGYVTLTTAFPTLPDVFVDGLLSTVKVPGPKFCTFAFTSSSVMLWLYGTVNVSPVGLYLSV